MPTSEAQKRASAKWRAKNKEKSDANVKRWREENPERFLAASRLAGLKWYYKNREAQLEKGREKRRLAAEARMREYEERVGKSAPAPVPDPAVPIPTTDSDVPVPESAPEITAPVSSPAPAAFVHPLFG